MSFLACAQCKRIVPLSFPGREHVSRQIYESSIVWLKPKMSARNSAKELYVRAPCLCFTACFTMWSTEQKGIADRTLLISHTAISHQDTSTSFCQCVALCVIGRQLESWESAPLNRLPVWATDMKWLSYFQALSSVNNISVAMQVCQRYVFFAEKGWGQGLQTPNLANWRDDCSQCDILIHLLSPLSQFLTQCSRRRSLRIPMHQPGQNHLKCPCGLTTREQLQVSRDLTTRFTIPVPPLFGAHFCVKRNKIAWNVEI